MSRLWLGVAQPVRFPSGEEWTSKQREWFVRSLKEIRAYHHVDMGNPIPHLVSPRLVEGGPRVRSRPELLRQ